jgi:predicted Rossmann-fold nucleotide-binding protein
MRTYKHRRNYAEACICDGAIAFEGGDGTISEVLFALQLGHPVIVVGPGHRGRSGRL